MSLKSRVAALESQVEILATRVNQGTLETAKARAKANSNEARLDEIMERLWPLFRNGAEANEVLVNHSHSHDD